MSRSSDIEVVLGTGDDMHFLIDLGRRTALSSVSEVRPVPAETAAMQYVKMLDYAFSQKAVVFVAKADDESVGFLLYVDFLPDDVSGRPQGFVAYMAVEPEARRRGVGRKLLAAAEEHARMNGLPEMALMVTESNEAALAAYAQAGYLTERRLLCKKL